MNQGGGVRLVDIAKSATKEDIIKIALELFFKNGESNVGAANDMEVDLLTFKREKISTIQLDGKDSLFTLELYIEAFKLSRVRLYLSTKAKHDDTYLSDPFSTELNDFDKLSESSYLMIKIS